MDINTKEIEVVKGQASKALESANALTIKTDEELVTATDFLSRIKAVQKLVKDKKEAITKPLNEGLKQVRAFFSPVEDTCAEAESVIKTKMLAFQAEKDRKAKEDEKKILDRVERGTMTTETAMKKLDTIPTPEKKVEGASGGAVQFRTVREVVITDAEAIPRNYLVPDMVAIRKDALAGIEIPGVKVEEKQQVSAR